MKALSHNLSCNQSIFKLFFSEYLSYLLHYKCDILISVQFSIIEEMMKESKLKKHDEFFRVSLSNREIALDFFKAHLPSELWKIYVLMQKRLYWNGH
jgi:hypothetical protein